MALGLLSLFKPERLTETEWAVLFLHQGSGSRGYYVARHVTMRRWFKKYRVLETFNDYHTANYQVAKRIAYQLNNGQIKVAKKLVEGSMK